MHQTILYNAISHFDENAARGALKQVISDKIFESRDLNLLKNNGIPLKGGFPAAFSIQLLRKFWSEGKLASPEMLLYCQSYHTD